jgi:hypothetical protein
VLRSATRAGLTRRDYWLAAGAAEVLLRVLPTHSLRDDGRTRGGRRLHGLRPLRPAVGIDEVGKKISLVSSQI